MADAQGEHDPLVATAAAGRLLATAGATALPAALDLLAAALSVEASVVVRRAAADGRAAVAVSGGRGDRLPRMRSADSSAVVSLPLRVDGCVVGFLTVMSDGELGEQDVTLIEAFAGLVALALAAAKPGDEAATHVLDEAAERAEVAAALHEGPVASLVAARYALDIGNDPAAVRAVVQQALRELRRIVAAQRPHGIDGDLARGLAGIADDLRQAGCTLGLLFDDPGLGGAAGSAGTTVPPACAVTAYRVVAAACHGVTGPATVRVSGLSDERFTVTVTGALDPHDAGSLDRWARRARALGGTFERHPDGVTLQLPSHLAAVSTTGAVR